VFGWLRVGFESGSPVRRNAVLFGVPLTETPSNGRSINARVNNDLWFYCLEEQVP